MAGKKHDARKPRNELRQRKHRSQYLRDEDSIKKYLREINRRNKD